MPKNENDFEIGLNTHASENVSQLNHSESFGFLELRLVFENLLCSLAFLNPNACSTITTR